MGRAGWGGLHYVESAPVSSAVTNLVYSGKAPCTYVNGAQQGPISTVRTKAQVLALALTDIRQNEILSL